jgi:uncharacterized SAM-binding protein YcdF (DUF218 family)
MSWLASGTLEWWYPPRVVPDGDAEVIVVLSGSDTQARYQHAGWLHTHWRALPVLASVGRGHSVTEVTCSALARRVLQESGVPSSMILIQERSANTYEDALYGAEILRRHSVRRIALVTEAFHMLRAEKCFRRQGLKVVPAPCRYRTARMTFGWAELVPRREYLLENKEALHEWIGLAWYLIKSHT